LTVVLSLGSGSPPNVIELILPVLAKLFITIVAWAFEIALPLARAVMTDGGMPVWSGDRPRTPPVQLPQELVFTTNIFRLLMQARADEGPKQALSVT